MYSHRRGKRWWDTSEVKLCVWNVWLPWALHQKGRFRIRLSIILFLELRVKVRHRVCMSRLTFMKFKRSSGAFQPYRDKCLPSPLKKLPYMLYPQEASHWTICNRHTIQARRQENVTSNMTFSQTYCHIRCTCKPRRVFIHLIPFLSSTFYLQRYKNANASSSSPPIPKSTSISNEFHLHMPALLYPTSN